MSDSLWPYGLSPTSLLCPWDSPAKNTGVGCHFLFQGIFPTRDQTWVPGTAGGFFSTEPPGKPLGLPHTSQRSTSRTSGLHTHSAHYTTPLAAPLQPAAHTSSTVTWWLPAAASYLGSRFSLCSNFWVLGTQQWAQLSKTWIPLVTNSIDDGVGTTVIQEWVTEEEVKTLKRSMGTSFWSWSTSYCSPWQQGWNLVSCCSIIFIFQSAYSVQTTGSEEDKIPFSHTSLDMLTSCKCSRFPGDCKLSGKIFWHYMSTLINTQCSFP